MTRFPESLTSWLELSRVADKMTPKFLVLIFLLLLAFSPGLTVDVQERVYFNFGTERETSPSINDPDVSSNINHPWRLLSRLLRSKLSGKILPGLHARVHEVSPVRWVKETSPSSPVSKHDLYQTIKVYRL